MCYGHDHHRRSIESGYGINTARIFWSKMSHFIFKAKHPTGETYNGEKDAVDRFELYKILRESGDEIVSFQEKKMFRGQSLFSGLSGIFSPVNTVEKIRFARNLGSMLEAGLSLSRALAVLEKQTKNRKLKEVLGGVIKSVTAGSTFSDALAKYPKVFPKLVISMVHAGEQSGTLAESLKVIATQMDNSYTLEKRIKGALIYPAVILCLMIIIAILMFVFVVPTLMKTFTELHVELPLSTRIVLWISDTVQNQGLWVLMGVILVTMVVYYALHTTKGRSFSHWAIIRMPIVGPLVQEINAARTARTLSSLLGAGVDVVESVNITAEVIQNVHFKAVLDKASKAIKTGEVMSKIFGENEKLYPVFLSEMMSVGEETGDIKNMLLGVAHYYEDDVEQKTKDMSTVIEPVLMVIIGSAVGFFAVSMITPMYSLVNAIN